MYWRALAASAAAIVLSIVAMSPMFAASASTTSPSDAVSAAVVPITDVQGTGDATPLAGQTVTVHGIVTAVLPSFGGIYVQSATAPVTPSDSGTPASDAVFVVTTESVAVSGDLVSVTGVAGESAGQTQIVADSVSLIEASAGLPATTPLPDSVVGAARESYEGMLVSPTGTYYLDSVDDPTGSLVLSAATTATDAASRLVLDDGINARVASQPFLLPDTVIRAGDTLVAPQRPLVLAQNSAGYALEPTVALTSASDLSYKPKFTADSPRLGDAPVLTP